MRLMVMAPRLRANRRKPRGLAPGSGFASAMDGASAVTARARRPASSTPLLPKSECIASSPDGKSTVRSRGPGQLRPGPRDARVTLEVDLEAEAHPPACADEVVNAATARAVVVGFRDRGLLRDGEDPVAVAPALFGANQVDAVRRAAVALDRDVVGAAARAVAVEAQVDVVVAEQDRVVRRLVTEVREGVDRKSTRLNS